MAEIPSQYVEFFQSDVVGILSTLSPDGNPHQTPIWLDYDGQYVLLNTTRGRRKEKNVRQHKSVSLCVMDPNNPYRYVSLQGEVVEVTEDNAVEHIDSLAKRYLDKSEYPSHGQEEGNRVILKVLPKTVTASTRQERKENRK